MNYVEMTKKCGECRMMNDDVSCKDCQELKQCPIIVEYKEKHPNANLHFVEGVGWCI